MVTAIIKKLKELIDADPQRIHSLKYTILQPLPKHLTINEILKEEIKYKNKLGTRAYGLNLN
ncbi:hypothetical protein RCO48_02485 [Peribacillus frigoritolerans]|nr:hypothetical protein [Peribacillus frigoritolerans]